jgi:hypothetical protein
LEYAGSIQSLAQAIVASHTEKSSALVSERHLLNCDAQIEAMLGVVDQRLTGSEAGPQSPFEKGVNG